jgi:hypothetical protein
MRGRVRFPQAAIPEGGIVPPPPPHPVPLSPDLKTEEVEELPEQPLATGVRPVSPSLQCPRAKRGTCHATLDV